MRVVAGGWMISRMSGRWSSERSSMAADARHERLALRLRLRVPSFLMLAKGVALIKPSASR